MRALFTRLKLTSLIVFIAGSACLASDPVALPTIVIRSHVVVAAAKVHFSDLLTPGDLKATERSQRLENTVVAISPLPGKTKTLDGRGIRDKLAELGIRSDRYIIQTPDHILVERQAQILVSRDIEEAVRRDFLPDLPWHEVLLAEMEIPEPAVLPTGKVEMTFQSPLRTDLARAFYLNVDFRVDGQTVKRAYYRTVLRILHRVPVAERELLPSTRIVPGDVRWETRPLRSTLQTPIQDEAFFEVRKPRGRIGAGESLTESMFVPVPLIRRGDAVTLVFENGRIRITASGQSLASGSRGDRIRVMNTDSRAELIAEVVDARTVRIVN